MPAMSFTRTIKKDWFKALSDDFHCLIGYSIAEWAEVERQLFAICWTALRCPLEQAAVVYARTPTIDSRLRVITDLLNIIFPKPGSGGHRHKAFKRWEIVTKNITTLLPVRNRIAHHPTGNKVIMKPGPEDAGGFSEIYLFEVFGLHLSDFDAVRGKHKEKPELYEADLAEHLAAVTKLREELLSFRRALVEHVGEPLPSTTRA